MKPPVLFTVLFLVQLVCAFFFLYSILISVTGLSPVPIDWQIYELIELGAALGLVIGVAVSARLLAAAMRREAHAQERLRLASGAFVEVMEGRFTEWGLTPAERDVALFCVKGLSTSEIAGLRGVSEGTVKAQTNAIYRKAGVNGRAQLLSLFIDELMDGPLPQG